MASSETPRETDDAIVWVSDDKMGVYLTGTVPEDDPASLVAEIREQFNELGIPTAFTDERLVSLLRDAAQRKNPVKDLPLLKGIPPEAGKDGYIEWAADFFNPGFAVDPDTGNIDYRKRAAQVEVEADQLLATIVPPEPGKAGVNVMGEKLPPGRPFRPRVIHRKNVRHDEESGSYYARINGRVRWEDPQLEVDEVIVIKDDVGLASGDIDHRGAVIVEGDVQRGATIQADGDVDIRGVVEAAHIATKGSLTVHKGVFGADESKIEVGGSVHAHFLNECDIEAGREVVVEREIVHSKVKTRGELICPNGRLFGGEIVALGGIVVGQAGSEGMVRTVLTAGYDFKLRDELEADEERAAELKPKVEKAEGKLKAVLGTRKRDQLQPAQRTALAQAISKLNELRSELDAARSRIENCKRKSEGLRKYEIEMRKRAYPEVVIHLAGHTHHLEDELIGPVRARLLNDRIRLSD